MKKLIIFLLFSLSLLASTSYDCRVRNYKIELDMTNDRSTHIWVTNTYDYNLLHQGYAGSIDRGQKNTSFYFYGQSEPIVLSFINKEIENNKKRIKAHIEAQLEGFYFTDYFTCSSK